MRPTPLLPFPICLPRRPLRIVVYGDMRFTDPGNTSDTQPRVRKWLAGKVGEEKPDLLLLTGDMPFHGSEAADWKIYDQETASWAQQRLRVYPTIGNHEDCLIPGAAFRTILPRIRRLIITTGTRCGWETSCLLRSTAAHSSGQAGSSERGSGAVRSFTGFGGLRFLFVSCAAGLRFADCPLFWEFPMRPRLIYGTLSNLARLFPTQIRHLQRHIHNYERFELNGITHVISGAAERGLIRFLSVGMRICSSADVSKLQLRGDYASGPNTPRRRCIAWWIRTPHRCPSRSWMRLRWTPSRVRRSCKPNELLRGCPISDARVSRQMWEVAGIHRKLFEKLCICL